MLRSNATQWTSKQSSNSQFCFGFGYLSTENIDLLLLLLLLLFGLFCFVLCGCVGGAGMVWDYHLPNNFTQCKNVVFFFFFFCWIKIWGGGWPTWQSYLGVTIVAPYLPGFRPCWGARGLVSHSFPSPTRSTSDPRLPRKATPRKSIFPQIFYIFPQNIWQTFNNRSTEPFHILWKLDMNNISSIVFHCITR